MKAKMVQMGNSLAVRISQACGRKGAHERGRLEIETTEGQIELRRITSVPSLNKLIAQITPENRYGEISTKLEVGKEAVEW